MFAFERRQEVGASVGDGLQDTPDIAVLLLSLFSPYVLLAFVDQAGLSGRISFFELFLDRKRLGFERGNERLDASLLVANCVPKTKSGRDLSPLP